MKFALLVAIALAACGGDLPPQMFATAHVRYHARTLEEVPAEARLWLENYRFDLLSYFGVLDSQDAATTDYYLFRDKDDLTRNSPCPGIACTVGTSVYSAQPLDDYELVHGFLAPIGGAPPFMIAEGAARSVSCYPQPALAQDRTMSWQALVTQDDSNTQIAHGEPVVEYLLEQFGPARFIKYYGDAHFTRDPALFALEFERSFGRTFASVWDAALNGSRLRPVCPCALNPVPLDATFDVAHGSSASYRPLDMPDDASVLLTLPAGSGPTLKDCGHRVLSQRLARDIRGTNLAVMSLVGNKYLSFPYAGNERLTTATGDWVTSACSAAAPVTISTGTIGMVVVAPHPGAGASQHVRLSIEGSRSVADPDAMVTAAVGQTIELCADCVLTACTPLGVTPIAASGDVVLVIRPGGSSPATQYAGARLSFE